MDSEAILKLAEAIQNQTTGNANSSVSSISAVAFKAPPFWNTNAAIWFVRLEAAFATHSPPITSDLTRFHHVIQLLDSTTSRRVQSVIQNPPESGKYQALKSALLEAYEPTQTQKDNILLNLNGLGDKRPSELLQEMKSLNSNPETLFTALFLNQLPPEVRRILAQGPKRELDEMAKVADRIMEVEMTNTPSVGSVSCDEQQSDITPGAEVNAFHKTLNRQNDSKKFQNSSRTQFTLCKYHSRFGNKAKRCDGKPCPYASDQKQGNS